MNFKKLKERKKIGQNISIIYRATKAMFESKHKSDPNFDLSISELPILSFLIDKDEDIVVSQEVITKGLGVDKATTTRGIKKLCNSGYITRVKDKNDKRAYNIRITEKGKLLKFGIMNIMLEWTEIVYNGVTLEEMELLKSLTNKMVKNIKKHKEDKKHE